MSNSLMMFLEFDLNQGSLVKLEEDPEYST